jgi:DNA processing protein
LFFYPKFSLSKYRTLKQVFGDFEHAWSAEFGELTKAGFDESGAHEFLEWRNAFREEACQRILENDSIRIISIEDPTYPPLLKEIFDPPVALFVEEFSIILVLELR